MRVKLIKWLIRLLLTGYHLSHNPTKKIATLEKRIIEAIEKYQSSTSSVQIREEDSDLEPVRMED